MLSAIAVVPCRVWNDGETEKGGEGGRERVC
jgi:hypothetical protein